MMSAHSDIASGHYLVGDIGGTNARFAFVEPGSLSPTPLAKYRVADFASFEQVLEQLIGDWRNQGLPESAPSHTCLAVAAPPHVKTISFTNSPWRFDRALLSQHLGDSHIEIINDFAAVARALPALTESDVEQIGAGESQPNNSTELPAFSAARNVVFGRAFSPRGVQSKSTLTGCFSENPRK
jgi:glucokinase